jgi:pyruvate,water dikinase
VLTTVDPLPTGDRKSQRIEESFMTTDTIAPEIDPRYLLDPADQAFTFVRDLMHFPNPACPLFESVHSTVFPVGYVTAARELHLPIADFQLRYRNHYQYERMAPIVPASEDEARALGERAEAACQAALPLMEQRWREEHLPRIRELLAELSSLRGLDPATPLHPAQLNTLLEICIELWTIHFRIAFLMLLGIQLFDEFISDIAGPDANSHAMLTGLTTESVNAGIGITDLAASARDLGLAQLIRETPADQLHDRLSTSADGRVFLAQTAAFLDAYGLTQSFFDFTVPTWVEDPTPLYLAIKGYLETGGDNRAAHAEQIRQAEAATAAMRQQLETYPEPMRGQFEALLVLARAGSFLQEEHNFYIDQQALASVRLAFLAIGRQLVWHGRIGQAEDIFFLHLGEIHGLLCGEPIDARDLVAQRRASYLAARQEVPPPFLGAPPSGGPPADSPAMRALGRFFGLPPAPAQDPNVVPGHPGSRGSIEGPAFVARTLEEASTIPPGHVLVTITTTPSWTPLFGIAAAIVTETGGPLSHCAIVAREYGIPAVVGAAGATQRIATGQMIRVDGTAGEVTILS